jgi:hypothetical protein
MYPRMKTVPFKGQNEYKTYRGMTEWLYTTSKMLSAVGFSYSLK